MLIDKRHSPNEVRRIIERGLKKGSIELVDSVGDILVEDFREFMASQGYTEFSPADLCKVFGCNAQQGKDIFSLFNSRLKMLAGIAATGAVSQSQQAAHRRHDEKRKTAPRLPGTRLSESESETMERLYVNFESKTEAIVKAAKFYLAKSHN